MVLVLVHGAWHGAWCWSRVRPALAAAGVDRVVTPTLTGLGERSGELDRTVGLRTHVDDVVELIDRLGEPVVLAGHSYAGLVVREAADRRPDAVAHLVLVDGWTGADGDSLLSLAPAWMADYVTGAAVEQGDGWRIPPPDPVLVGVDDPLDAALLRAHLTDHPLATFTDPTRLTGAAERVPTSAITAEPSLLPFRRWADEAGWPTTAIAAGHDLMLTAPVPLARSLAAATVSAAAAGR
jgi:pimeloyl-ACP methyl ester carboxylesterase